MLSYSPVKNSAGVNDIHLAQMIKNYGAVKAVRNIDLAIERGKFFSLLGPSGCGKTTTLRLIAGFESPTSGTVWIDGKDVTAQPAYRRDFAMVFQNLALFPHLSVAENVAFGLKMRHVPKAERGQRVQQALDLVKLSGFGDRRIRQLSGGQQQRVALARAIVVKPAVLLLDEPLSALDKNLREDMQIELRQLQRGLGITTVFVTHDQEEALTLSDEIAVMNNGIVEQLGSPKELYSRPRTKFIASFLGSSNFLSGKVIGREDANAVVEVAGLRIPVTGDADVGSTVELAIRPENIRMAPAKSEGGLAATIREVVYRGATTFFLLEGPAGPFSVHVQNADASSSAWRLGDAVKCHWAPESTVVVKSE